MDRSLSLSTVVITGASSGIGAEFARELVRRGTHRPVLVARRLDRLESLARELARTPEVAPLVVAADLSDPEGRRKLYDATAPLTVDGLINNAGFGSVGPFVSRDAAREEQMVILNCVVPLLLARHYLPPMQARGQGAVVNVCSTAAFQPLPYMATYGATKSFLLSFSLALSAELRGSGVRVLAQCPGPVETEFHLAAGLKEKLAHLSPATAAEVVKETLDSLARGAPLVVNGARNRMLATVARHLPPAVAARLVAWKLRAEAHR